MQTGVSTASLFLRKYNEEALPLLDSLGVKTAEIFLTTFSEYGEPFARTLLPLKGDINVHSVHILNTEFEPQLFNAHPRARADAYAWLERVMQGAKLLDAKHYTFHGTARVKKASRSGENDDFKTIVQGFEQIVQTCEKYGVTLCLENVEWSTYNRVGVFEKIAPAVPTLKGVLDIKQARISGYPYERYLQEMGAKIAHVHLSDIDERGNICLPGKGTFDFSTLVKRLQDVGFDGPLLIEVYKNDYGDEQELKTACDYLDEILYKHGCLH